MNQLITSVRVGHHTSSNRMIMAPMTRSRAGVAGVTRALVPTHYVDGSWTLPEGGS